MRNLLFKDKELLLEAIESFKEDLRNDKEDETILQIKPFLTNIFTPYNVLHSLESKIKSELIDEGSEWQINGKSVDLCIKILYRYYSKLSRLRDSLKDKDFPYSNLFDEDLINEKLKLLREAIDHYG